jgi:membrane glycosyltransferase
MPIWFPVGLGLLWAVLLLLAGEWVGLRRFRLMGVAILLAGIVIGIWQFAIALPTFPVNPQQRILPPYMLESVNRTLISLGFLTLISGIILMLSGLVTFLRYRKENPIPYTEDV